MVRLGCDQDEHKRLVEAIGTLTLPRERITKQTLADDERAAAPLTTGAKVCTPLQAIGCAALTEGRRRGKKIGGRS
jgi:hypothetical protein